MQLPRFGRARVSRVVARAEALQLGLQRFKPVAQVRLADQSARIPVRSISRFMFSDSVVM